MLFIIIPSTSAANNTVYSDKDTHVIDGAAADINFGTQTTMGASNQTGGSIYEILMSFDTSSYDTVDDAKLYIYSYTVPSGNGTIELFNITDRTWQELTVTYNTKPTAESTYFASKTFAYADQNNWFEINITDYVNDNIGNEINFYIRGNHSNETVSAFRTKEYAGTTYDPYVVIDDGVPSGTAIYGNVYEVLNGVSSPLDLVTVYIYNNTYSSYYITSVDGNYIFTGLDNSSTYIVYAAKQDYDTTPLLPVTTLNGTAVLNNIPMKAYINIYDPDNIVSKFHLAYTNGTYVSDATSYIYEYGEDLAILSGVTGDDGVVVFKINRNKRYNVTFEDSNGTELANWSEYPSENVYIYVYVPVPVYTPGPPNASQNQADGGNMSNATYSWGLSDLTSSQLTSLYDIGPKGQGIIMGIIALFMIPYGGLVAMIVIAFGFAYIGLITYKFVIVCGVFSAAWYIIKKEFT